MISPRKWLALRQRMQTLNINETDIDENFILGRGSGGQKRNKTTSCVQLKYQDNRYILKCDKTRSRQDNRYFARHRLCQKVAFELEGQLSAEQQRRHKIKRQKAKRSKRAKQKILADKSHRSAIKQTRQKPTTHDD